MSRTFTPPPAPAPAPVRWPEADSTVLVTDGDGRREKATVAVVVNRGGQPEVAVRPSGGLRLKVSDGGLMSYSSTGDPFTWRWPD